MMLDVDRLRKILRYDAETGVFTYLVRRGRVRKAGDIAGFISRRSRDNGGGYRIVHFDGRDYGAHRLAWFYVHGKWPTHHIDHRNNERDDNRISNLREATRSQNCANKGAQSNNTSGLKGVSFHKGGRKWRADIKVAGETLFLGLYKRKEAACAAYDLAAYMYFGEFARLSKPAIPPVGAGDEAVSIPRASPFVNAEAPVGTLLRHYDGHPEPSGVRN